MTKTPPPGTADEFNDIPGTTLFDMRSARARVTG